ncbi:UNVERIFIED_CONTAM: hypothetical protein FKN15_014388 [Acipenser sinensis]
MTSLKRSQTERTVGGAVPAGDDFYTRRLRLPNGGAPPPRSESAHLSGSTPGVPKMGVRARVADWPPRKDGGGSIWHISLEPEITTSTSCSSSSNNSSNSNLKMGHLSPQDSSMLRSIQNTLKSKTAGGGNTSSMDGRFLSPDCYPGSPRRAMRRIRQRSNSDITISELEGGGSGDGDEEWGTPSYKLSPLHREYGSTSSIDKHGASGESFFDMLKGYQGDKPDQRSQPPEKLGELLAGGQKVMSGFDTPDGPLSSGAQRGSPSGRLKERDKHLKRRAKSETGGDSIFRKLRSVRGEGDQPGSRAGSDLEDGGRSEDPQHKPWCCQKGFAHFDIQSILFDLNEATLSRQSAIRRRNTTTGASAAAAASSSCSSSFSLSSPQTGAYNSPSGSQDDLTSKENLCLDPGDDKSNELVLSCPCFRNEIGGEGERKISMSKLGTIGGGGGSGEGGPLESSLGSHCTNAGVAVLEVPKESQAQHNERVKKCILEHVDLGCYYYRKYFYLREHWNYFGVDENLGPVAVSLRREKLEDSKEHGQQYNYRVTFRTSELTTLRGSILEDAVPSTSKHGSARGLPLKEVLEYLIPELNTHCLRLALNTPKVTEQLMKLDEQGLTTLRGSILEDAVPSTSKHGSARGLPLKEVLEYLIPELNTHCLRLALNTPKVTEQLMKLDEQGLSFQLKVGVMYCKAGQSREEEMYNNESAGPAFEEFLMLLGDRIRLKGFSKYRAQLDTKTDSTGTHSLYTVYKDYEIMFHVSTMLPYTPNNKQQLLRKRHIGNDIVTIVFQEPGAQPFSPKNIRSHFQHVFVVVRAHEPCSDNTCYRGCSEMYRMPVVEYKTNNEGAPYEYKLPLRNHSKWQRTASSPQQSPPQGHAGSTPSRAVSVGGSMGKAQGQERGERCAIIPRSVSSDGRPLDPKRYAPFPVAVGSSSITLFEVRHSPLSVDRQSIGEMGSSGKSTPSWQHNQEADMGSAGSERPAHGKSEASGTVTPNTLSSRHSGSPVVFGSSRGSPREDSHSATSPSSQTSLSPGPKTFYPRQGATSKYLIGWRKPGGTINSVEFGDTRKRHQSDGPEASQAQLRPSIRDLRCPQRLCKSTVEEDLKKLINLDSPPPSLKDQHKSDGPEASQAQLRPSIRDLRSPQRLCKSTVEEDLKKLINLDSPPPSLKDQHKPSFPSSAPCRRSLHRTLSDESIYSGQREPTFSSLLDQALPNEVLFSSTRPLAPSTLPSRRPTYILGVKSLHGDLSASDTSLSGLHRAQQDPGLMPLPNTGMDSGLDWSHLVDAAKAFEDQRTSILRGNEVNPGHESAATSPQQPERQLSPQFRLGSRPENLDIESEVPSSLTGKVSQLESIVKLLQEDLKKEKEDKAVLQLQVQSLREDNQRLQEESQNASAKLNKFTEWVFNTIDMN